MYFFHVDLGVELESRRQRLGQDQGSEGDWNRERYDQGVGIGTGTEPRLILISGQEEGAKRKKSHMA